MSQVKVQTNMILHWSPSYALWIGMLDIRRYMLNMQRKQMTAHNLQDIMHTKFCTKMMNSKIHIKYGVVH